eukprot:4287669-Karenia_brevis.AAC.1
MQALLQRFPEFGVRPGVGPASARLCQADQFAIAVASATQTPYPGPTLHPPVAKVPCLTVLGADPPYQLVSTTLLEPQTASGLQSLRSAPALLTLELAAKHF